MPIRNWTQWLCEDTRIEVEWDTTGSTYAVVLLHRLVDQWHCVTRYDNAHGFAHQDIMSRKGRLKFKRKLPIDKAGKQVEYAIKDYETNWQAYIKAWKNA